MFLVGKQRAKRGNGGGERQIPGNSEAQQQDGKIFTAASLTLPALLKKVFSLRKEEKKKKVETFSRDIWGTLLFPRRASRPQLV